MDKARFEERLQRLRERRTVPRLEEAPAEADSSRFRKIRRKQQRLLNLEMDRCSKQIQHQDEQKTKALIDQEKSRYQRICRGEG